MIRYALRCQKSHEFEAWFRSSDDYDRQSADGGIPCPVCGDQKIVKAPMAPSIGRAGKDKAASGSGEKVQLAAVDPRQQSLHQAMRELREKIIENADYVGDRFAEEARKIHYQETEPRGIYGEATREEAENLAEEGVEFAPLPPVPDDRN
jgi:hypothetical protein